MMRKSHQDKDRVISIQIHTQLLKIAMILP
ncbi:I10L [African swine fever virus]|uniref:I10L n=1 Tax=African swine fever virus TaxID=10497 RepID=A0A894ZZ70_ASF|nr:I10L [African swine fever virus]